jgi:hypothetical protein
LVTGSGKKASAYRGDHPAFCANRPVRNEHALIAAFVKRNKRDRYREILSNSRLRYPFSATNFSSTTLPSSCKNGNSPKIIFAISEDPALDQKELPLVEALQQIVGRGMGTVFSCIPGRLAFVEKEDERFILERHDPLEKREYVGFVIGRKDEENQVEPGIFQAAGQALEAQNITGRDADELNETLGWFGENLKKPTSSGRDKNRFGICWFKTGSAAHISRISEIGNILERNGTEVKKIRTDKPG